MKGIEDFRLQICCLVGFVQKSKIPRTAVRGYVQARPTKERGLKSIRIPPTAVGGWFKSGLLIGCNEGNCNFARSFWKYPNRSHVRRVEAGPEPSTNCRWWDSESSLTAVLLGWT
jgi:hypothetical protein